MRPRSVRPARPHRCTLAFAGLVAVTGPLSVACGDGAFFPPGSTLEVGTWGGQDAGVIVDESGVHVHIDCTFGDIPEEVPLDADGRFAIDGTYVLRAFPIVIGPTLPARFSGRVAGRTLTLSVAVSDTVEDRMVALGPVSVVRGRDPDLGPCPICRLPGARRR